MLHLGRLRPYSQTLDYPEKNSRDKHSSLFYLTISYEEKKGFIALAPEHGVDRLKEDPKKLGMD